MTPCMLRHRSTAIVNRTNDQIYQPDNTFNVVDLLPVTDLEAKPSGNGARRRKQ